jgi:Ran GTPase-activating protein (RanGAP) involved in mRNA processing and transport
MRAAAATYPRQIRSNAVKAIKIGGPLSAPDVNALFNALQHNKSITSIDFESCNLGDKGCKSLKTFFASNKTLCKLDLKCNNLSRFAGGRMGTQWQQQAQHGREA